MSVLQFIGKVITTSALVFVIVVLVPGVPPDVEFEVINAKPPLKLNGKLAPNAVLDRASPMKLDLDIVGPESIAISPNGKDIYTGVVGGEIIRVNENGQTEIIAKFGHECGRMGFAQVAGLRFDSKGTLFAADVALGIFEVDVDTGAYERIVPMDIPIDGPISHSSEVRVGKEFTYFGAASAKNIYKLRTSDLKL